MRGCLVIKARAKFAWNAGCVARAPSLASRFTCIEATRHCTRLWRVVKHNGLSRCSDGPDNHINHRVNRGAKGEHRYKAWVRQHRVIETRSVQNRVHQAFTLAVYILDQNLGGGLKSNPASADAARNGRRKTKANQASILRGIWKCGSKAVHELPKSERLATCVENSVFA